VTVDTPDEAIAVPETGELLEAAAGIPPEAVASGEELEGIAEVLTELEIDSEIDDDAMAFDLVGTEEVT